MTIAFLSDADTPHPFRQVPGQNGLAWSDVNSIEAIAAAVGADVWHGRYLTEPLINGFKDYETVMVNLKWPLWEIVPLLARNVKMLVGYQEDASDLAGMLPAASLEKYLTAIRSVKHLFVYDRRAKDYFMRLGVRSVSCLPLPAPMRIYDEVLKAVPPGERPRSPFRIAVGPAISAARGTFLSIIAASRISPGCRMLVGAKDAAEVGITSRLIAEIGCIPECDMWREWYVENRPDCWLRSLSVCSLAVNLDNRACYGRFVVDCAGLSVPCIGSREIAVQPALFPNLVYDGYRDMEKIFRVGQSLLLDPARAQQANYEAKDGLASHFSVARIRELFRKGIAQCVGSS